MNDKHKVKPEEENDGIDVNTEQETVEDGAEVAETEQLKSQVDDYKNKYLRALADYQNLEKRISEERIEIRKLAQIAVLNRFLPVLDNLTKAEVFIADPGLKLVSENFTQILKDLGLEAIEVIGKEYDPELAEAVEIVVGEKDNIMVEELRKGYRLNERVLRPAHVKVSKKVERN